MKPKLILLADRQGWAFDHSARGLSPYLERHFSVEINHVRNEPTLDPAADMVHVFFWGEDYASRNGINPERIVKEVTSHRWQEQGLYGPITPRDFCRKHLNDAQTIVATSKRLVKLLAPHREVFWTPNGIDSELFFNDKRRDGPLKIGWAGNISDPCKGVRDILLPAIGSDFDLKIADGNINSRIDMAEFYRSIDVLCIASTFEGEPLTLLEAMACGCFPVTVDVGIVPELVQSRKNGLIVDRTISSFRAALQWCAFNLNYVRERGEENALQIISTREWKHVAPHWVQAFDNCLRLQGKSRSVETSIHFVKSRDERYEQNLGESVIEWPLRAEIAGRIVSELVKNGRRTLVDLGCGRQTIRKFLPDDALYTGFDYLDRVGKDTVIVDLSAELPERTADVGIILGLLEYFEDPQRILFWASSHVQELVLSFNDCSDLEKKARNHWLASLSFDDLRTSLAAMGGVLIAEETVVPGEHVFHIGFRTEAAKSFSRAQTREHMPSMRTIALLTAALDGDNSGDALIEDGVRRLLPSCLFRRFALLKPLTAQEIEEINTCSAVVICGTNLYQDTFACALNAKIVESIRVPIIPLGIGSSASIGDMPKMQADHAETVRMIHDRCAMASVRDTETLRFVRSLGISNVRLTGCPVLFHAGREPTFDESVAGTVLGIRARLLHVAEVWNEKALRTLKVFSQLLHPELFVQSPYDVPIAEILKQEFHVPYSFDVDWQHMSMVRLARSTGRSIGFRLHLGMLSLSYGRHAILIASDTRVTSFCEMMSIPYFNIATYTDDEMLAALLNPFDMASFRSTWRDLQSEMMSVLAQNGLRSPEAPQHMLSADVGALL